MNEKHHIEAYKKELSRKLGWSNEPIQREYQHFSDVLFEKTNVYISTATLRRIWDNQYQRLPQVKTLDALAEFLDYEDWEAFKSQSTNKNALPFNNNLLKTALIAVPAIIFIILVGMLSFSAQDETNFILTPESTHIQGVPATVGFNYDIHDEDVLIELSWNPMERYKLDPEQHYYTATYFYPDYHHAKLIKNNEIKVEKAIHITSEQWEGMILEDPNQISPLYLDQKDFQFGNKLIVNNDVLTKYQLPINKSYYTLFTFSNPSLEAINMESLSFKAEIEVISHHKSVNCPSVYVYLKAEHGSVRLPISGLGCHGQNVVKFGDKVLSGKFNDLQILSGLLTERQSLDLEVENHQVTIQFADNDTLTLSYEKDLGPLKVVKLMYSGFGALHKLQLTDHDSSMDLLAPNNLYFRILN